MENKIVITSVKQCIEIIDALIDDKYEQENKKYASYLSMSYFTKNLHMFEKKYIQKILDNEQLSLAISSKSSYELLENAVKNNKVFTVYSKKWFINVKANQEVLRQYLEILLKTDDDEQIKDFCSANQALTKKYFMHNYTTNYMFEKYVIAFNPELIVNKKKLLEKDVIELINEGFITYKDCKTVLSKYSYQLQTLVTQKEVKEILEYDFTSKYQYEVLELLKENPVFFIKKIKEYDANYVKKLLNAPGIVNILYSPRKKINFLQSIVESESNKYENGNIKELLTIVFNEYKDILLKNVVKIIGSFQYEYKDSYLLDLYENKQFNVLKNLCEFNQELIEKEKDILISATFDCIITQDNYKNNNIDNDSEKNIYDMMATLYHFDYDLLKHKLEEIKEKELCDEKLIFTIEKFVLHSKLNDSLTQKNNKQKKMKI